MGSTEKTMAAFRHHPDILEGVAEHLTRDLKQYEDWFTIEPPVLKKITEHFVEELNQGLTEKGGNIVSISSFDRPVTDALTKSICTSHSP